MLRACRRDARPTTIGCRRSKGRRPFERLEERHAYTALYLREEIQGESLVRHLAPFSLFLSPSAHGNGHILNFTKIGADAQTSPSTFMELRAALRYFRIKAPLSFWRSGLHEEVDFIIGDEIAIEFKSKKKHLISRCKRTPKTSRRRHFKRLFTGIRRPRLPHRT